MANQLKNIMDENRPLPIDSIYKLTILEHKRPKLSDSMKKCVTIDPVLYSNGVQFIYGVYTFITP